MKRSKLTLRAALVEEAVDRVERRGRVAWCKKGEDEVRGCEVGGRAEQVWVGADALGWEVERNGTRRGGGGAAEARP